MFQSKSNHPSLFFLLYSVSLVIQASKKINKGIVGKCLSFYTVVLVHLVLHHCAGVGSDCEMRTLFRYLYYSNFF